MPNFLYVSPFTSLRPLFAVLGFLTGRTATVSPSDILFLLGLGLHLAIILGFVSSASEVDAVFEDILKIVHINDGKDARQ